MSVIDAQNLARALGGEASGYEISAPGPGHKSAGDRSLSVKVDPGAPDGFVVHSFAGDDPIECKDYVREKSGLDPFKPNSQSRNRQSSTTSSRPRTVGGRDRTNADCSPPADNSAIRWSVRKPRSAAPQPKSITAPPRQNRRKNPDRTPPANADRMLRSGLRVQEQTTQQFAAAGMKQKTVEVAEHKSVAFEKIIKRRASAFFISAGNSGLSTMLKPSSLMSHPLMCSVFPQHHSPLARTRGPAREPFWCCAAVSPQRRRRTGRSRRTLRGSDR